ncbi:hypothetical protein L6452_41950 [Arctium lappa]|uniref:Uncharacterized protein n=1 Tax=Arctium lappa TaxID=4217 RepID=A0ACB8XHE0_ARCLA|nr:hypothetical protein L6452_41950 [Arctium lappa]
MHDCTPAFNGVSTPPDCIYKLAIDHLQHNIFTEECRFPYLINQFPWSSCWSEEFYLDLNIILLQNRQQQRIVRAYKEKRYFKGCGDDVGATSVNWQYQTISRGHNSILQNLSDLLGPRVHDYISFYGLGAHGRLSDDGLYGFNVVVGFFSKFKVYI